MAFILAAYSDHDDRAPGQSEICVEFFKERQASRLGISESEVPGMTVIDAANRFPDTLGDRSWLQEHERKLAELLPATWTHESYLNGLQIGFQLKLLGVDWKSEGDFGAVMAYLEQLGIVQRQHSCQLRANPASIFGGEFYQFTRYEALHVSKWCRVCLKRIWFWQMYWEREDGATHYHDDCFPGK